LSTIAIHASGLVTPVGFNAASSLAAMRAGIRRVREVGLWDPESAASPPVGKVDLPQWWVGLGKLADLVAPAIHECLEAAKPTPPDEIVLLVGLPSPLRPYRIEGQDDHLFEEIERRLDCRFHSRSAVLAQDHVSAAVALRDAAELIEHQGVSRVIVAAVDSLLDEGLKNHYIDRNRLLTPENSNGFCLGEAGSAILVGRAGAPNELRIKGLGFGNESATIESDEPLKGDGLAAAIRAAFDEAGSTMDDIQYRITDLNGEHYKFKEMMLAMMRFPYKPKPRLLDLWHPNEYMGDVGAAIGPIVLATALHAGRKGYGIGPRVLCTFGNDDGARAAIVVEFQSVGR
jgi:3-oxoacyl-[acyl-carrier-protein] synthase-1